MFHKLFFSTILLVVGVMQCNHQAIELVETSNPSTPSLESRVDKIMEKMSLEDKVGEMTQLSIDVLSVGEPFNLKEPHELDPKKMEEILVEYRVGSILNAGGHSYTKEHWYDIVSTIQEYAAKKESKIPVLYGIDAIHGASYTLNATLFPQQIAQAASWNPESVKAAAAVTAYETRASSIPWTFSPVLDMGRDPRWPRFWETYGEDVHLASVMGEACINGYEGDDNDLKNPNKVAACLKHFLGYSVTMSGKDRTPAWIPERQLREYFLPTFKKAIDAGASTIMINSGEMNGIPVHTNKKILTDLLKEELGFDGIVLTDWQDIKYLYERHRVAKDNREAVKMAINAGIDMSMVPMDLSFTKTLAELVRDGEVPMSRIDDAVRRILKVKIRLGLFENPTTHYKDYPNFASKASSDLSLSIAEEAITLLKNEDNILPLSKSEKYLVVGPTAHNQNYLNGGWTHTWQGDKAEYNTPNKHTIVEAIQEKIGKDNVTYLEGASIEKTINIPEAKKAAKGKKAAIICIGEATYTELVGNLEDLSLPKAQTELVEAIAATGTPIVLVMVGGRPRIITDADAKSKATLMAYLPGDEGGKALANILFGEVNPSGKLPFTYPRAVHSLVTYDHKGTDKIHSDFSHNAINPLYEFGHGLSYTTFEYSDIKLSSPNLTDDGTISVSIEVKNTGNRTGKEVVQLYTTDYVASITPSVKRLRGFKKIELKANESKTVKFDLTPRDLAFVGINNEWITEPGKFGIEIGNQKIDFHYHASKPISFGTN